MPAIAASIAAISATSGRSAEPARTSKPAFRSARLVLGAPRPHQRAALKPAAVLL